MRRALTYLLVLAVCGAAILLLRSPSVADRVDAWRGAPTATNAIRDDLAGIRGLVVLPEDGRRSILDEIDRAQESIDLYVYLLPADEVLTALSDAHLRGVEIRVILERDPFGGGNSNQDAYDRLFAAGIEVRWAPDQFQFSHIKSFVVDHRVAAIMTLNLSWSGLTANREFAVITTVPADVDEIERLFEADWSGSNYQPSGDFVTSPDNSRVVITNLISGAEHTIEIYAEVVRDTEIRQLLIASSSRGVAVRILAPANPSGDDLLIYRELEANGIQVKLLADAYSHAKAIIVDQSIALVGSQNLTYTSLDRNRECGMLLRDRANLSRLVETFRSDWSASPRI